MAREQLKSAYRALPDAVALRRVATDGGRSLPSAVVRPSRRAMLINFKVSLAVGLPVDPLELKDRGSRRAA